MADPRDEILSTLIDAAFSTGGITDVQHTELHGKLDAATAPEAEATEPKDEATPDA